MIEARAFPERTCVADISENPDGSVTMLGSLGDIDGLA
jgi:hypothetical protein